MYMENDYSITLCVIVKNEEKKLPRLLSSINDMVNRIIVMDTGSVDNTINIAEQYGADMISYSWNNNFGDAKNAVIKQVCTEWVLILDADEVVTEQLKKEIKNIVSSDSRCSGYFFPRKNYYLGKWLKYGGQYPDYQLKLFKNGKGHYAGSVHEKVIVDGEIGYLENPLEHYPYNNVDEYLKKIILYTTLEANILYEKNISITFFNSFKYLFWIPIIRFSRRYILKGGFLDGISGLFACLGDSLGFFIRYIKLRNMYNVENFMKDENE